MSDKKAEKSKVTSVVAREESGDIQITFTIPYSIIENAQKETAEEMAKDITVPGYRKGNAPIEKVLEKIPQEHLVEHSLSHILPHALSDAIKEHDIKIAIYPKFELVSAEPNKPWEIRAKSCELPEFKLPDYKSKVPGELRAISLKKEATREEKEQVVVRYLIENTKFTIPKILVEEEVNSRLSNLLEKVEKLGLTLEGYLKSIGKDVNGLRSEYEKQAEEAIRLDLVLSKIIEAEDIKVGDKEVQNALEMSEATEKPKNEEEKEQRKRVLSSILKKRKALEFLTNLS